MNSELVEPRLVKVRAGRRGSGWAIGQRGVLTARHVVQDFLAHKVEACLAVPDPAPGAAVFDCDVTWHDATRDLAVLRVRAEQVGAWETAVGPGPGAMLAKPGTDKVDATAVGYPAVAIDSDRPQPEQAPGTLLPAGGAVSGRMPFDVDTSVPDTADLWKGISGAVLRDGHGRLLGVVIEADNKRQQRRLYVAVLPDPASDTGFAAALSTVGAVPVLEAADAPRARELLALLDEPTGRPYTAATMPNLGELGTRESRTDIDTHGNAYYPYIARTVDAHLVNALDARASCQDQRLLLVVGEPMTGKSRTLAEAVRRHATVSSMDLLVPHRQCDLRQLARFVPATGALLWLDDLNQRVTALDRDLMRSVLRIPRLVMVGTLRADELRLLQDKPDMRSAWDVLNDPYLVEQVKLKQRWTEQEQQGLSHTEPVVREAVSRGWPLGEILGAAKELSNRLAAGTARGQALVHTVADWSRTGVPGHMLEERAKQLWVAHLDPDDAEALDELTDDDREQAFLDARSWACGTVGGAAALLTRTKHGLAADNYVVAQRANQHAPIPLPIWCDALTDAQQQPQATATTLDLAYRAAVAGVPEIAKQVWEPLAAGDTDDAPEAAVNLGVLLSQQGDREGARAAYQQAIDSGHADVAPLAAVNLGVLLEQQDNREGAQAAYQHAIDSGHADAASKAALNLGVLLEQQDNREGARAAYQQAIDSGHADVAPLAAANLGVLLEETDPQGARAAFQQGQNWVRVHVRAVARAVSSTVVEVMEPRTDGSPPTRVVRLEPHADSGTQVLEEVDR